MGEKRRSSAASDIIIMLSLFVTISVITVAYNAVEGAIGRRIPEAGLTTVVLDLEYLNEEDDEELMEAVYGCFMIDIESEDGATTMTAVPDRDGEVWLDLPNGDYSWYCTLQSEPDPEILEELVYLDPDGAAHPFGENYEARDTRLFTVDDGDVYGTTRLRFDYEGDPGDFYVWAFMAYDSSAQYEEGDWEYEEEGFDLEELTMFLPVVVFVLVTVVNIVKGAKKNKKTDRQKSSAAPAPERTYAEPAQPAARSTAERPKSWQVGQSGKASGSSRRSKPAREGLARRYAEPKELPTAANTFESDSNVGGFEEGRSNRSFYDDSTAPEYAFDVGRHKKPPQGFDR